MNGLSLYLHVAVDHVEMPLVDRQVDRLADRAAGVVQRRRHVGQLDEVAEVLDVRVAPALVEVADERRAVGRARTPCACRRSRRCARGCARAARTRAARSSGSRLRHRPRGKCTRSPLTSAPASLQSASASASSRKSMPISSRIVSALCSMSCEALPRPAPRSTGVLRVMYGMVTAERAARAARLASRPPPRLRRAVGACCSSIGTSGLLPQCASMVTLAQSGLSVYGMGLYWRVMGPGIRPVCRAPIPFFASLTC